MPTTAVPSAAGTERADRRTRAAPAPRGLPAARAIGAVGAALVTVGGFGAGAAPATRQAALLLVRGYPGVGLVCVYCGLVLLVAAWWRVGRLVATGSSGGVGSRALLVTLAYWVAPLLCAPPMFSRDVYSYLAQGQMVVAGLDVYRHGPAVLGGVVATEVPDVWQHTPAPYGPVFLIVAGAVTTLIGTHLVVGLVVLRLVAVAGLGLTIAALPRLAERCGVSGTRALWLVGLNPLVLIHLVVGVHNDALMLGLLTAGLTAAVGRRPMLATVLVTLAGLVKVPAAAAFVVVVVCWAAQLTGRWRAARAALGAAVIGVATMVTTTALAGTGYGWIRALHSPLTPHNWSLSSGLARLTVLVMPATSDGLAESAVTLWRWVGVCGVVLVGVAVWVRRERLGPVYGLGIVLVAVVAFGPAFRPWYLLWGLVPIAASAPYGRVRTLSALVCACLVVVVLPSGFPPEPAQLGLAAVGVAAAIVVLGAVRYVGTLPQGGPPAPDAAGSGG